MRDLPVMISVIGTAPKMAEAASAIEAMLEDGLIVTSDAETVRLVRSGSVEKAGAQGELPAELPRRA